MFNLLLRMRVAMCSHVFSFKNAATVRSADKPITEDESRKTVSILFHNFSYYFGQIEMSPMKITYRPN